MSRCFPYPPPGYTKDSASGEALIKSIKLKREKEKFKIERKKDKKREKKEKKEKKREKEREKSSQNYPGEGKRLNDSSTGSLAFKGCQLQKGIGNEVEQLEKSSITEDHEHGCVQNPSESSDSTHNSHKRKRDASPLQNRGNIIRIRLPLQRHNEYHDPRAGKEQVCSTSGRTESLAQLKVATSKQSGGDPRAGKEKACSTSGRTESLAQPKFATSKQSDADPRAGKEQACSTSRRTESLAQPMVATSKQLSSIHPCTGVVRQSLIDRTRELSCPLPAEPRNFGRGCAEGATVSTFQNGMQRGEYPVRPMVATTKILGSNPTFSSAVAPDLIHRPEKELPCPTSADTGNFGHGYAKAGAVSKRENRMQIVESLYESLTENWFPVQLTEQADFSDLEWLLGTEQQDDGRERAKRCKTSANNDGLCWRSPPTLCPRACLLSEADIYALPFTVPF